jgi:hypothetical protein
VAHGIHAPTCEIHAQVRENHEVRESHDDVSEAATGCEEAGRDCDGVNQESQIELQKMSKLRPKSDLDRGGIVAAPRRRNGSGEGLEVAFLGG